ncbi:MAG TPA: hypothetical protein VMQ11_13935 [Alphaproteobacteria bacterium]|nr:hypothetical protein [Alphaproteobacteria bacterium]
MTLRRIITLAMAVITMGVLAGCVVETGDGWHHEHEWHEHHHW